MRDSRIHARTHMHTSAHAHAHKLMHGDTNCVHKAPKGNFSTKTSKTTSMWSGNFENHSSGADSFLCCISEELAASPGA
jgi:hypothetical protein